MEIGYPRSAVQMILIATWASYHVLDGALYCGCRCHFSLRLVDALGLVTFVSRTILWSATGDHRLIATCAVSMTLRSRHQLTLCDSFLFYSLSPRSHSPNDPLITQTDGHFDEQMEQRHTTVSTLFLQQVALVSQLRVQTRTSFPN